MKKIAKSKGVMISSIISLLLSLVVLATVSMAWLSMNKETASDGMQMKVDVTPNLIIDGDKKDEAAGTGASRIITVDGPSASNFSITFNQDVVALRPATHDDSYSTKLKYVTNPQNVDVTSGVASSAVYSDAAYVAGPPVKRFYVDYTVYLASTGTEMPINSLTVEIVSANCKINGASSDSNTTLKAASIDFYVGTPASGTYKGTLNVAGLTYSTNTNGAYNGAETSSVTLQTSGSIPYNKATSGDKYITITMRCYFDGALSGSAGTTFINTTTVDTSDVELAVKFTATTND
jgi:hypothetical protein